VSESSNEIDYTAQEMMAIAAARALEDYQVCFVGIGAPSRAANLARATHAPHLVMVYESGCIGSKPTKLPQSIGDGDVAETADALVSASEIFNYWLQSGRIDIGFLGGAQIDRFGNINTTVIGDYEHPQVRLPGAGGATEIAGSARQTFILINQSVRTFVRHLPFRTTVGFGDGPGDRERLGLTGSGPSLVITNLGLLKPDPVTCELVLTQVHFGVDVEEVRNSTGWNLAVSETVTETAPPTTDELTMLRRLDAGLPIESSP